MTTPTNRIEETVVQASAESGYGRMLDEIVTLKRDLAAREDGGVCEWTPGQERPEAIAAKGGA